MKHLHVFSKKFSKSPTNVRAVQHSLQTSEKQEKLHSHYDPLGQKSESGIKR